MSVSAFAANGQVGGQFGFSSVLVRVLNDVNVETYSSGNISLPGFKIDLSLTLPDNTIGEKVILTLFNHQDPICSGFDELRVFGFELKTGE